MSTVVLFVAVLAYATVQAFYFRALAEHDLRPPVTERFFAGPLDAFVSMTVDVFKPQEDRSLERLRLLSIAALVLAFAALAWEVLVP